MSEQEILYTAFDRLENLTGFKLDVLEKEVRKNENKIDTIIKISKGKKSSIFSVEIKKEIRENSASAIINQLERLRGNKILIARYITAPLKDKLKELQFNYLELAGNCYIQTEELFIYINDQKVSPLRVLEKGKLWNASGLKFLFAVIQFPELVNSSQRNIAHMSRIALGTVGSLIQEMKEEGFLKEGFHDGRKMLFLEQRFRLIERWAELYMAVLRPKLSKGKFKFVHQGSQNTWQNLPVDGYLWGGENAGALLTNYLTPEQFTIYTEKPILPIMRELKIVPDQDGSIEIFEKFWETVSHGSQVIKTVPFLVAYAELITSFDSRCRETAARIKEQYLE